MTETSFYTWTIVINASLALFTLILAIVAGSSARAARRAAEETRRAAQGQLVNSLFDSYASKDMLEAMLILRRWETERGDSFADEFRRLRHEDYSKVREIDEARRRVSHHFEKIHAMWSAGVLDEPIVRSAATKGQVEFLREVVEPLEEALNPQYGRATFDGLGNLHNIGKRSRPMANP